MYVRNIKMKKKVVHGKCLRTMRNIFNHFSGKQRQNYPKVHKLLRLGEVQKARQTGHAVHGKQGMWCMANRACGAWHARLPQRAAGKLMQETEFEFRLGTFLAIESDLQES